MLVWIQMSVIGTPAISVKAANTHRLEQGFQHQKCLILSPTKAISHHPTRLMIKSSPQRSRLLLAADKRPHFIQFRPLYLAHHHRGCCSLTARHQGGVHLVERTRFFLSVVITVVGLTPRTRAVSR